MNNQEIFNTVYTALRDQGFVRCIGSNGNCVYRNSQNQKCAFGHLIPDEVYEPDIEGINARILMSDYYINVSERAAAEAETNYTREVELKRLEAFKKLKAWSDTTFSKDRHEFIALLQRAHDLSSRPEVMKARLQEIAEMFELKVPE